MMRLSQMKILKVSLIFKNNIWFFALNVDIKKEELEYRKQMPKPLSCI